MFKKTSLFAALITISFCSTDASISGIETLQNKLDHIAQEKKAIALDASRTVIIGKKALHHVQNTLHENYDPLHVKVMDVINIIFQSEEFDYSVNKITDHQTVCIVDQNMHFDDITYNPAEYPIDQKINHELATAFPELDGLTEQLFNIWYVINANMYGSQLLLSKLTAKEDELQAELAALEAAN